MLHTALPPGQAQHERQALIRVAICDSIARDLIDAVYAALQDADDEERIVGVGCDGEPIYVGGSRQVHGDILF